MELYNDQLERECLSTMIHTQSLISQGVFYLRVQDFENTACKIIFSVIEEQFKTGKLTDEVTIKTLCEQNNKGVFSVIKFSEAGFTHNFKGYIEQLRNLSYLRGMKRAAQEIQDLTESGMKFEDVKIESEKLLFQMIGREENNREKTLKENSFIALNKIEKLMQGEKGLQTGIKELDKIIVGLEQGQLITIAARASMGKSSFVFQILKNISETSSAALFSFEMTGTQLANRYFSNEADLSFFKIRHGLLSDNEVNKIVETCTNSEKHRIYIDDSGRIDISELSTRIRIMKKRLDIKIIVIDHIGYITAEGEKNRHSEVGIITKTLKSIAKDLEIPIIILSQLNRQVEGRAEKKPVLSDLKESGSIEEDSDIVMMLYREDYYNKDCDRKGLVDILIKKNRDGMTGEFEMMFIKDRMKFIEIPKHGNF